MNGRDFETVWSSLKSTLKDHLDRKHVRFSCHALEQMIKRDVSDAVVDTLIRTGRPTEMYKPQSYPFGPDPHTNTDPVFTVVGKAGSRKIAVAVAISMKRDRNGIYAKFTILTVKTEDEGSRHWHQ